MLPARRGSARLLALARSAVLAGRELRLCLGWPAQIAFLFLLVLAALLGLLAAAPVIAPFVYPLF